MNNSCQIKVGRRHFGHTFTVNRRKKGESYPPPQFRSVNVLTLNLRQKKQEIGNFLMISVHSSAGGEISKPVNVSLNNSHGETLKGLLVNTHVKDVSILCHGFRSSKASGLLAAVSDALAESNQSTFRFDFSGNGESEGTFSYGNYWKEVEDLRAVVLYLRSQKKSIKSIIGHSKGGSVVMLYASKYRDVPRVVNLSGRFDLRGGIAERLGPEGLEQVESNGEYEVVSKFDRYTVTRAGLHDRLSTDLPSLCPLIPEDCKVLTVHGKQDQTVLVGDALSFDKAVKNHMLVIIEEGDHNFKSCKSELVSSIASFLSR